MNLHEVLNLYGLHSNPESLDGHDKAKESLTKRGNWAYLWVTNPGIEDGAVDVDAGNTDLYTAKYAMRAEGAEIVAEPFTPSRFQELLREVDEYYISNADFELQNYPWRADQKANYQKGRAQFVEAVSKFKPASIASLGIEYDYGVGVFEHSPSIVDIVFGEEDGGE